MSRTLRDADLQEWEVFATPGRYGFPEPARVVFRCTSDPGERPRSVVIDGDKSDAEALVAGRSDGELKELMEGAEAID